MISQKQVVWVFYIKKSIQKGFDFGLEGVKVIQTIVESGVDSQTLWLVTIICLLFAFAMVVNARSVWKPKQPWQSISTLCVAVICLIVIGFAWYNGGPSETRYVVSIDDTVSFNEFQEKYDIIRKNGDNYVVRMRTN